MRASVGLRLPPMFESFDTAEFRPPCARRAEAGVRPGCLLLRLAPSAWFHTALNQATVQQQGHGITGVVQQHGRQCWGQPASALRCMYSHLLCLQQRSSAAGHPAGRH